MKNPKLLDKELSNAEKFKLFVTAGFTKVVKHKVSVSTPLLVIALIVALAI